MLSMFSSPAAKGTTVESPSLERKTVVAVRRNFTNATKSRVFRGKQKQQGVVPEIAASINIRHRFRYLAGGGINASAITVTEIFGTLGVVGTLANTTAQCIASSFRVRKVHIFESAQSVATVAAEVLWFSGQDVNSKDEVMNNATIPYDRPSHIVSTPPKGSLASFWWNTSATGTTTLFSITCAIGAIVDVEVDYTLGNASNTGLTYAPAAVTLGNLYYLNLNGFATGTSGLVPVALPTTH